MAIQCPKCGTEYDVTLFEFDRRIRCDCGGWVDLAVGHRQQEHCSEQAKQSVDIEAAYPKWKSDQRGRR